MPKVALLPRLYYATVDFNAVANTTILDAISGKRFYPLKAWVRISTWSSGDPTVSIGNNSTTFDNIAKAQGLAATILGANSVRELLLGTDLINNRRWNDIDISSAGLTMRVSVAAGAAMTGIVYVMGIVT